MDLGFKVPDYRTMADSEYPKPTPKDRLTKIDYPSLTISGNKPLAQSLKLGQEFTAMVKFRVTEISIRDRADDDDGENSIGYYGGGTRVELDVISMDPQGIKMKDGSEEEGASSALDKFMSKRKAGQMDEEE